MIYTHGKTFFVNKIFFFFEGTRFYKELSTFIQIKIEKLINLNRSFMFEIMIKN